MGFVLAVLVAELEHDARLLHRVDDLVDLGFGACKTLLAVHVNAALGGGDGDGRMPVIGRRTQHQVDVARIEQLLVGAIAGRRFLLTTTRAHGVGRRVDAALGVDIEQVAHAGELEVEVVLVHERGQVLVARIARRGLGLAVGPLGRREAGAPDIGLATAAVADDAEA